MIAGLDVAEQQSHPDLGQGGHVGAHDPHPSSSNSPGKILPRYTQQLGDGLLIKPIGPELAKSIRIEWDPLTPHPGSHISYTLLCRPSIGIKLEDYVWVKLGYGGNQRCPPPVNYLLLEVDILVVPELDASLPEK
ncbi:hypothetical protein GmHk_01G000866 [Glycine max]|nr:hypothetical protein GmHk_01G000866 [Glycine max]